MYEQTTNIFLKFFLFNINEYKQSNLLIYKYSSNFYYEGYNQVIFVFDNTTKLLKTGEKFIIKYFFISGIITEHCIYKQIYKN